MNTHNVFYSHRVLNIGWENSQIGTETSNNTSVSQRIVIYKLWSLVRTYVMTWIYTCSLFLEIVADPFLTVSSRHTVLSTKYISVHKSLIRTKGNIHVYACHCWFKIHVIQNYMTVCSGVWTYSFLLSDGDLALGQINHQLMKHQVTFHRIQGVNVRVNEQPLLQREDNFVQHCTECNLESFQKRWRVKRSPIFSLTTCLKQHFLLLSKAPA